MTKPVSLAILSYSQAMQSAVHGLSDLLQMANQFQCRKDQSGRIFEISVIKTVPAGVRSTFDIIVLPPALTGAPEGRELAQIADWLPDQHAHGALLCSVCAGSFPLAASGLLDNRTATTHWALAEEFAARYPMVKLDVDKLVIDDGDIITAGGLMAWVDLGLKLVHREMGPSIMSETARFFLVDPSGREQRFYSSFSPRFSHGDTSILKAQHWLQENYAQTVSIADLADAAALGLRTFSRRFVASTGLNASEYVQNLRISKAREMLEFSQDTVDAIAYRVGYEDSSAFRKVFFKIVGLTPREYRKRFTTWQSMS